ncbi:MAG: hypothetical protein ACLGI9_15975, partial [Thermoanaerobaculia bacterium]
MAELESALAAPLPAGEPPPGETSPDEAASRAFLDMIRPLTGRARARLEAAAQAIVAAGGAPFDAAQAVSLLWPAV